MKKQPIFTYHIVTFGCQMNTSDSERVATIIEKMGFVWIEDVKKADFILINTCSVRQKAEDKVFGYVHNYQKLKKDNPRLIIGVMGCMPGRYKRRRLKDTRPNAELFFPTEEMTELPKQLAAYFPELINTDNEKEDYLKLQPKYQSTSQAFIPIMTGCNNMCSYCVVPYSRGKQKSRSVEDILKEIQKIADQGCKEVTLLGQNVNSYNATKEDFSAQNPFKDYFAALLWEVNQISGIERIHFTAPHPHDMTEEVIDAMMLPKHVRYLHLPVQSGSNTILEKMRRDYTQEEYKELVQKIRTKIPDIALGTDIIVGFCGETKKDFLQTLDMYQACNFDISYTAIYSPRSGTLAMKWEDDISYEEKKERFEILQDMMRKKTLKKNQIYVGKKVDVLVDDYRLGMCKGNSQHYKRVVFKGSKEMKGKIVKVVVNKALEWILEGDIV
jgi:tRNA-2-methylthio-N6-dimethylallyladenosine synthase